VGHAFTNQYFMGIGLFVMAMALDEHTTLLFMLHPQGKLLRSLLRKHAATHAEYAYEVGGCSRKLVVNGGSD
jgi:hypothetical protein